MPDFNANLVAVTDGGTGIAIQTEGDTAPGAAVALLSVISTFDVDAFEFDFQGDGTAGPVDIYDLTIIKQVDSSSSTLLIEASLDTGTDMLTETVAQFDVAGLNFEETAAELSKALATLLPDDGFDLV